jgi:hypothetical protein
MRRRLTIVLLAGLLGCERETASSSSPAPKGPGLHVTGESLDLGPGVKAVRFSLHGSGCRSAHAALYHISGGEAIKATSMDFQSLPDPVTGDLWLTQQAGEPFGKSGVFSYSLTESVKSPSKTAVRQTFPLIDTAYPQTSQQFHKAGTLMSGQDAVIFARCMSRTEDHSFGAGSLDQIKQHVQETNDIVVVVTLRWEPN